MRCLHCNAALTPDNHPPIPSRPTANVCRSCWRQRNNAYGRAYTLRHPDKKRENFLRWYERNREVIRAKGRERYAAQPDRSKIPSYRWREANPEKYREGQRDWRARNPDRVREYERRAKEKRDAKRIAKLAELTNPTNPPIN